MPTCCLGSGDLERSELGQSRGEVGATAEEEREESPVTPERKAQVASGWSIGPGGEPTPPAMTATPSLQHGKIAPTAPSHLMMGGQWLGQEHAELQLEEQKYGNL